MDAMIYKTMFTVNRIWGSGDNLDKHWVGHKANHANFLAKHFTAEIDGEEVAYSLTNWPEVSSSNRCTRSPRRYSTTARIAVKLESPQELREVFCSWPT